MYTQLVQSEIQYKIQHRHSCFSTRKIRTTLSTLAGAVYFKRFFFFFTLRTFFFRIILSPYLPISLCSPPPLQIKSTVQGGRPGKLWKLQGFCGEKEGEDLRHRSLIQVTNFPTRLRFFYAVRIFTKICHARKLYLLIFVSLEEFMLIPQKKIVKNVRIRFLPHIYNVIVQLLP